MSVLDLVSVTKTFRAGGSTVTAVDRVDLEIGSGELVIIMGPSGSGKTTLLQLIGALLTPTSGTITVSGRKLADHTRAQLAELRLRHIGFIFQGFNLFGALDALDNVAVPAALAGINRLDRHRRAHRLLDQFSLGSRAHHRPDQLSGGEKQRVAIARALMNDPELILADEPTANLDAASGYQVLHLLQDIVEQTAKTAIVVTHDHRITDSADRLLWLADGELRDRPSAFETAVDPVCGMEIIKDRASATREHAGDTLYFCSQICVEKFDAEPERWTHG
jgi:putative ABC transport system ATP-binding protein